MATMRIASTPKLAPMRVAQISKPGGDFEIVDAIDTEPRSWTGPYQGTGLRCLPQRRADKRGSVAGY